VLAATAVPTALASDNRVQPVRLEDRCDPNNFPAALCPRNQRGNVGIQQLLEFIHARPQHVLKEEDALGWRFDPDNVGIEVGSAVQPVNIGGETHTFTPLPQNTPFQDLGCVDGVNNALLGTPLGVVNTTFCPSAFANSVESGHAADPIPLNTPGTYRFQCFIHPWMRTTVEVKSH
jgi:plastocyanin